MVTLRVTDGTRFYTIAPLSCQGGQQKATVSSALWQMGEEGRWYPEQEGAIGFVPLQEGDGSASTKAGAHLQKIGLMDGHLLTVSYHPKPLEDKTEPGRALEWGKQKRGEERNEIKSKRKGTTAPRWGGRESLL